MKILHVAKSLDPAEGGPPSVIVHLAAAQAGLGHDVHVLSYGMTSAADKLRPLTAHVPHWEAVKLQLLPPPTRWENLFAWNAGRALKCLVPGMDVVHLHGVWTPIFKRAADEARRLGKGYLVAPHSNLAPYSLSQKPWKKRLALALGRRGMLQRAQFIHIFYAAERQDIQFPGVERFEVIPNGVSLEEIEPLPVPGSFRERHPELGGEPFILFLGRLHYKKGLDLLVTAFAALTDRRPDVRLVIAGPDDGERAGLERQVTRLGVAGRVHFVGPLYGADKFAALVDALCFCLPSRYEAASVAILEAMACRAPLILTPQCNFPEAEEAGAGVIVAPDVGKLAEALERVVANPDYRRALGQAGRELIEREFRWERIAEQSIRAYQKSLGSHSLGVPIGAGQGC